MRVSFEGSGWGLGEGREREKIFLEGEEKGGPARRDAGAAARRPRCASTKSPTAGDPDLIAAGFILLRGGSLPRRVDRRSRAGMNFFPSQNSPSSTPAAQPLVDRASAARPPFPLSFTFKEPATRGARRSLRTSGQEVSRPSVPASPAATSTRSISPAARASRPASTRSPSRDALYADNPVPFAVTLAPGDWAVVSNSPELFLDVDLAARRASRSRSRARSRAAQTEDEDVVAPRGAARRPRRTPPRT